MLQGYKFKPVQGLVKQLSNHILYMLVYIYMGL